MHQAAEVICVGSELLLGQVLNTNAQFLAQALAQLGMPHYFQTVVGDNPSRIHQALDVACARSGVLILTGGLGPTADDLTHETLADYFHVPLVEDPQLWLALQELFTRRGRIPSPTQRKQCQLPQGADVLPNPWGTAVGICWEARPGLHILTFPGVPSEMTAMWQATAVPYLRQLGWGQTVFLSELLRFWGVGEANLAEAAAHLLDNPNPTVAPYALRGEVQLRVTASAQTEAAARILMAPVIDELIGLGGDSYFGGTEASLARVVGELLRAKGQSVAVAESCTGGLLGQLLSAIPGSSDYFGGGVIAYANAVKISLLAVDPQTLDSEGAVSTMVAQQMAQGIRQQLNSDWGIAITGVAGPGGGTIDKPVGLVYIALAGADYQACQVYRFGQTQSREMIRWLSAHSALDQLRRRLK